MAVFVLVASAGTLATALAFTEPSLAASDSSRGLLSESSATLPTTIFSGPGRPFEPSLAVDASDPLHIVATSMERQQDENGIWTIWLRTHVSRDGGESWTSAEFPGRMSAGPTHPLFLYDEIFDAVVNVLPDGTVLLVAMAARQDLYDDDTLTLQYTTAGNLFVARSFDGGETWPDIRILRHGVSAIAYAQLFHDPALMNSGGAFASFNDKDWVAVGDDGTILLTWMDLQFPSSHPTLYSIDLWYAISKDAGETWTAPALLVDGQVYPALPAVMQDGGLRVAYRNLDVGGQWELVSSDDGGSTWSTSVIVPASEMGPGKVTTLGSTLVRQPLGEADRLFLPFATSPGPDPVQQLKFVMSDDGGATWSAPVSVDGLTDFVVSGSFTLPIAYPSAAVADRDGSIFVTYFHMPVGTGEVLYKVVRIRDGVASEPEVLDAALPGSPLTRGHYMGLGGSPTAGAYAAWVTGGSWTVEGGSSLVGRWL